MKVLFCCTLVAALQVSTYALKEHKDLEMATESSSEAMSEATFEAMSDSALQVEAQREKAYRELLEASDKVQKQVFDALDPDGDGKISMDEILKNDIPEEAAQGMIEHLDHDLDGKINKFELFTQLTPETGYFQLNQQRKRAEGKSGNDFLGPNCMKESEWKKYWQWVVKEIRALPTMDSGTDRSDFPRWMIAENYKANVRNMVRTRPCYSTCNRIMMMRKMYEFSSGGVMEMIKGPTRYQKWYACDIQEQAAQLRDDPVGQLVTGIPRSASAREAAAKRIEDRIIGNKDGCNQFEINKYNVNGAYKPFEWPKINIEMPKIPLANPIVNITKTVEAGKAEAAAAKGK